ncbi:hypothetical protein [Pinirhizobacter sp.]|uniref:hypothetical protein n=1 Tax=Pinirhizobacter sp. TaxID=2950432 RepID=UPI002F3E25C0
MNAPAYPAAVLSSCPPPITIQALVVVDGDGNVTSVRIDDQDSPDPTRKIFIDAVRSTAATWKFNSLVVDQWKTDAHGKRQFVSEEERPFSLGYEFHFQCRAGKADVGLSRSGSRT